MFLSYFYNYVYKFLPDEIEISPPQKKTSEEVFNMGRMMGFLRLCLRIQAHTSSRCCGGSLCIEPMGSHLHHH